MSFDGFWSPWSDTVSAVTPYSSGEINLRCSTADLQSITCQWKVNKTEADTLYSLYYQTSRELVWKICGNQRNSTIGYTIIYRCTFATSDVNETSIIVNASNPYYTQTFYEEHFRTDNVVRPDAPRIVKTVSTVGGKLRLIWEPPITKLLGHMIYQIRYSEQNGTSWKTLLIQKQLQSEMLDLPHSKTYYMQLRTKPNGIKYKGFWSSWSDTFTATIPGPMGVTTVALITGSVLLLVIALIMPRLIFPNAYSNVKKKLWPQIPNLDRLLEGYLSDFQKYPQPACDKHADDELLPSVLEIISERKGRNSARCVEKQEEVCQTDHLSASSIIRQHRASVTDGTLHGETKSSSNSSQNYILLDLQGSLPFLQEDIDFDKKDKSSSFQESQSLQWLHNPNSKNQNKTIQKDIHWIKPPPFSVQSINSIGTKQQSLTPLVCYDDMFTFFGHFRFPVSVDYRSMSAMDISNHSYLMASDFKPGIFSLRSSLAKE
ncbi:thrombopoietin receptor [Callorhinchus milii]|uniref:thrombopoietin receptor n=1 Tax=Callorhinchus milii TaxID=7868 RepID=UPI001C3F6813|nr:thrombopoietin receptor [Callorhinchus milii]